MEPGIENIGVLTCNRADLLWRLYLSIDYPVGTLAIVNNGQNPEVDAVLERIKNNHNELIECVKVFTPNRNLGCAGGWNLLLANVGSPYCLLIGDDIKLAPGDLAKIADYWERHKGTQFAVISTSLGFNVIGIPEHTVKAIGNFDENFWPVYYEDGDFNRRLFLAIQSKILTHDNEVITLNAIHGDGANSESCTSRSWDGDTFSRFNHEMQRGKDYFRRKWGDDVYKETYPTPFNDPNKKLSDWTLERTIRDYI